MAPKSAQDFIPIKQVRDGVIILKNKGLRSILMVSSINIALKSREEQEAILHQFQAFLNSLDFPCQIVVQSRKTNITGYIEKIKKLEEEQENDLLKHQTAGYREFLEDFVHKESIYTKNFFVVIPYAIPVLGGSKKATKGTPVLNEDGFKRGKDQLYQRMEFVALGLRRCGLHCAPLTTIEIIELFWSLFHPKSAESGYYPEFPEELIS
jgi:type IV secretory pathway VirB4 component